MDRARQTKLMAFILSGGLAFSGLSYAQNNANDNSQNAGNNQGGMQTNAMPGTTDNQGTRPVVPDDQLKSQVQSALGEYSATVQVQVSNGVVSLSGQMDSDTDYERAVTLAESVKGVQDVNVDNLTVKGSDRPLNDTYITAKVRGALIREDLFGTDIPSWTISVETKNAEVFLSGKVDSEAEKQKIKQIAQGVRGVTSVNDQIQVSSQPAAGAATNGQGQTNGADTNNTNNDTETQGNGTTGY